VTERFDTDTLPPTEYLVMEVLAARTRLGETGWTFPSRLNKALETLEGRGLVRWKSATIERHSLAWLTDAGRGSALSAGYRSPAEVNAAAEERRRLVRDLLKRHRPLESDWGPSCGICWVRGGSRAAWPCAEGVALADLMSQPPDIQDQLEGQAP